MFNLTELPEGFHHNPWPTYRDLRENTPVC